MSNWLLDADMNKDEAPLESVRLNVRLLSRSGGRIRCEKGLVVDAPTRIADCPKLDVLLVPGGTGVDDLCADSAMLAQIRELAGGASWVASVCNGTFALAAAGLTSGKRVTTHWAALDMLRDTPADHQVIGDVQYVRDGRLLTSAGVSAGIDMALWLLGQLISPQRARVVQRAMQYSPAPPYAADV